MHGYGLLLLAGDINRIYSGEFVKDWFHGKGKQLTSHKSRFAKSAKGTYRLGCKNGQAIEKYADGTIRSGTFTCDEMAGVNLYVSKTGES
mmetsp:Transcript_9432/g.6798  ORF Transcript_9432/g.6798 Transcript_9432/m.6798 type:complete len:90 (+) Transcript_9432:1263-1532(+)